MAVLADHAGDEQKWVNDAFEKNWITTAGENVNETERDTWNMDPVALEKAFEIYPEVKLVVLVHLYGTPAKLDEIMAVCKKHGAVLVEDAAESFGATYKGKQTGAFGSGNIISFNGNNLLFIKGEIVAKIA